VPNHAAPVTMVTAAPTLTDRKVGEVVSGFKLARAEYVPEVGSTARLWVHETTGTELMSMSNSDENKTFGVVFRTPPSDSMGIPHILEHSVLCGSRAYPVKEPFVELIKASLNTFLNAYVLA
jgi:presequence protease